MSIFTGEKLVIFKTVKKSRVFQKSAKNSKKITFFTKNSAGSRGPQVKEPIWVFFVILFSFCVEQQGKEFVEAIKCF
jgi:hypothetical protein